MTRSVFRRFAFIGLAVVASGCASPDLKIADAPNSIAIAPPEEALTFARAKVGGQTRLMVVTSYADGNVLGFDLSRALDRPAEDPLEVFAEVGYDGLRRAIDSAPPEASVHVSENDLRIPLSLTSAHIAAGTNFAEHAEEATVEDGPFLFAKMVEPTGPYASVSAGDGLLDYEVELAYVALSETPLAEPPTTMGLILCNDVTDRAKLMRHLDPADVTSGKGFTTGKSAPGYLPVGNLFVIPRDLRAFVSQIELNLTVNGEVRQQAPMTMAIWDLDEIFRQALDREEVTWDHLGESVRLPITSGTVPARTMFMAGTPGGTVFAGLGAGNILSGLLRWTFGGWGEPLPHWVIESYIARAKRKEIYLQPGDRVSIRAEGMGVIETDVVD